MKKIFCFIIIMLLFHQYVFAGDNLKVSMNTAKYWHREGWEAYKNNDIVKAYQFYSLIIHAGYGSWDKKYTESILKKMYYCEQQLYKTLESKQWAMKKWSRKYGGGQIGP